MIETIDDFMLGDDLNNDNKKPTDQKSVDLMLFIHYSDWYFIQEEEKVAKKS